MVGSDLDLEWPMPSAPPPKRPAENPSQTPAAMAAAARAPEQVVEIDINMPAGVKLALTVNGEDVMVDDD